MQTVLQRAKHSVGSVEQKRITVWLILGPSGAGKSGFGRWLATEQNWLQLEIDRFPEGDGIDLNNLRAEWNASMSAETQSD